MKLAAESLYTACDPASFHFKTTAELSGGPEIIGQPRAADAIEFGVQLEGEGFNIFALGREGFGRRFLVEHYLKAAAGRRPKPPDVCYANNIKEPGKPRLLTLPAGSAAPFREDVRRLIEDIAAALPRAFEGEDYQSRLHGLNDEYRGRPAKELEELRKKAHERGIAMLQTPMGFAFAPIADDEVIPADQFEKLDPEERERIQRDVQELEADVQKVLRGTARSERDLREKVRELNREVASFAVGQFFDELAARYEAFEGVPEHLEEIRADVTAQAREFLQLHEAQDSGKASAGAIAETPLFRRYRINVLVDNAALDGAPVLFEDHPTYENLVGGPGANSGRASKP
jgi:hypothetical protein